MRAMASQAATTVDLEHPDFAGAAALQHRPWISQSHLSSSLAGVECFLSNCGFARGPWLVVAFGSGAVAWFSLPSREAWAGLCVVCVAIALFALYWRSGGLRYPYIRQAILSLLLLTMAGCLGVWMRSEMIGVPAIPRPLSGTFTGRVIALEEQPALERDRLTMALREPGAGRAIKVRVNLPVSFREQVLATGTVIRFRGRLAPPAAPMFPGGYDFARTAWFSGISATGLVTAPIEVLSESGGDDWLGEQRTKLSRHITGSLAGSAGGIAAALTTGDMGAISKGDAQAMRDAGLAHLLSISGLHVSAVIGGVYLLALRLLALSPALALRIRLPVLAAGCGALAGIGYTLLSGSQVPTVRSCLGGLLVLAALALGREALSMRLLAVAAFAVLLVWPESIVGRSFQMSFAAVMVLVALGNAGPIKRWFAPREEAVPLKVLRHALLVLVMGIAIEMALMPIGLYHFHRAGIYGSFANVLAIPLTTLIIMPLVALALLLDIAGAGAPVWWLADHAIHGLLAIAHFIADRPGSVRVMPTLSGWHFLLFVAGGLWLGLWEGRVRLWGLAPIVIGFLGLMTIQAPDLMVSGDGRHVGWIDPVSRRFVMLRNSSSDYALDNMMEVAGLRELPEAVSSVPGARCNSDFCAVALRTGGTVHHVLIAKGRLIVPEDQLARACKRSDVVIADRRLPGNCRPKWLKADRAMLDRSGGITIDLKQRRVTSVIDTQGDHGW
jgi:competence protein ComEC